MDEDVRREETWHKDAVVKEEPVDIEKQMNDSDDAQDVVESIREIILKKREERSINNYLKARLKEEIIENDVKNTQDYLDIGETVVSTPEVTTLECPDDIKQSAELVPQTECKQLINGDSEDVKYANTQDYLDIEETVVAASEVATKLGLFIEEPADSITASDIRGEPFTSSVFEKMKKEAASWRVNLVRLPTDSLPPSTTISGLFIEEPVDRITASDIRGKPCTSSVFEKMKKQAASWRVNLVRLPTDSLPPSTTISGGAYIATRCSGPKTDEILHKIGLDENTRKVDGTSAINPYHANKLTNLNSSANFICEHCRKSFVSKFKLRKHLSTHIWRLHSGSMGTGTSQLNIHKPYKCATCDYMCAHASVLKNHMRIHTGEKPYKCKTCDFKCAQSSNLKIHMRIHTREKPYKCATCDYKSAQPNDLKKHMRTHTGEKPYKCKTCHFKSAALSNLKAHMRTHTGEKPYKCKSCDYISAHLNVLKNHMRIHTREKPYKCKTCDFKCAQSSGLKKHTRIHTGEKPYKCKTCDFMSAQPSSLKMHMRTHTSEKLYKCKTCDFKSARSTGLKLHIRTHTGERPYKCKMCDYMGVHSSVLKRHMRKHTGEKPCKCETCDYMCADTSVLKNHMRIHTREKPYKCKTCDFKCAQSFGLKRHMRIHTREKPYKCKTCDFKCAQSSGLKRHMRIHTREKPYKCKTCDFKCAQSSSLKRHMRIHTGEKP